MTGVGVNVTEVPLQMVVAPAAMLTEGTTTELTVIVMAFDVAVAGVAQVAVDVITQVITFPFASVVLV